MRLSLSKIFTFFIIINLTSCGENIKSNISKVQNLEDAILIEDEQSINDFSNNIPKSEIDLQLSDGTTALTKMLIHSGSSKNSKSIQDLLENGANPNIQSKSGLSALEIAIQNNHLEASILLIKHGARVDKELEELAKRLDRQKLLDVLKENVY